jgi:hypothetical protein
MRRRRLPVLQQPETTRGGGRLASRSDVELAQDRRDVMADGAAREEEPVGYLGVAKSVCNELQHFGLS